MLHLFTKHPFRLIVIDNGSTDGTREWLNKMKDNGLIDTLVFNKENLPLAESFNEGFKEVKSELFITSADDMMPPYNYHPYGEKVCWLTMLVATFKNYEHDYGSINFYCPRQGYEPFRQKRWPNVIKIADKEKLEKLHKIIYDDGNCYGLNICS